MKDFKRYLISKNIVPKKASLLFELGCSAYRYLDNHLKGTSNRKKGCDLL
jgi:hypothetical protein